MTRPDAAKIAREIADIWCDCGKDKCVSVTVTRKIEPIIRRALAQEREAKMKARAMEQERDIGMRQEWVKQEIAAKIRARFALDKEPHAD